MANEKRLIDANALSEAVSGIGKDMKRPRAVELACLCLIAEAPTVDAVEVVHGRWKYYHKQNIAVCTNCSFERNLDENFGKAVSCPNCGADMRGNDDA